MGDCCDNCAHGEVCCSVVEVRPNPRGARGAGRNRRLMARMNPVISSGESIESPIITPAAIMDLYQAQTDASARVARTNPSGVPWSQMTPESKRKWMIGGGIAAAVVAGAAIYWYRSR
jgi:hypothetical protein